MSTDFPKFTDETFLNDIELWVAHGGKANAVHPQSGWSLLHVAAEIQDAMAIGYLIHLGCDPNLRDLHGQTPLHIAIDSEVDGNLQTGKPLEYKVTKRLIVLGAVTTIQDNAGKTPIDWIKNYGEKALERFYEVVGNSNHV